MQRKEYFGLSLSLILIVALLTFINSNFFAITEVIVKKNRILTDQQVIEFAQLDKGKNIFQIDFDRISSKLMSKPQIKGVILKRDFPSTVEILIDEREPLVAIPKGNDYLLVDKKGWILVKERKLTNITYPILRGTEKVEVIGNKIDLTKPLQVSFQYLTGIKKELLDKITKVQIEKNENVTLYLDSRTIKFGAPIKINYKIKLLNQIYNNLKKKKKDFNYINLQYYDNPVIKFK